MTTEAPRVVIAMGDPAGISPELLAKLLNQQDLLALAAVTVIGDRRVLALGEQAAGAARARAAASAAARAIMDISFLPQFCLRVGPSGKKSVPFLD